MSEDQHKAGPQGSRRRGSTWAGRGPPVGVGLFGHQGDRGWAWGWLLTSVARLRVKGRRGGRAWVRCGPRLWGGPPPARCCWTARTRPRGPSRHWPPGRTHGAGGQTWSHAGPAVTSLFLPALSQALPSGPDAHFQSQSTHGLNMGIQQRYTFAFFFFFSFHALYNQERFA